ncbi:histidine phosphatase family protein [Shewanella sp.]|uniref:histidine phosphatase family protein n=1 Tax=Shewanella sp. TaxID=50422 RepID=UPI001EC7A693|nr:histidine phosphatase family protein [Shewanella sp.]NRB23923.1 histidine phosphatase family protein [Shewanella sp.]
MAAIYLIRHGQASFGKADYDRLSDKGAKQAQILGEHWRQLTTPDKYYSGDLLRHRQTAEHFLSGYESSDLAVITHSGFNEFNHVEVLTRYKPEWQDLREMSTFIAKQPAPNRAFEQHFTRAMLRWISGDYDDQYQESWLQFKQRSLHALQEVISQQLPTVSFANQRINKQSSPAKNILIFTSGGPISVIVQHILALADEQCLLINQQLSNTGVTKLLFSETRLSIDYLNNYSHLEQAGADWLTYR